nr:hypothetical protein [Tanacetum cinerariifolium]
MTLDRRYLLVALEAALEWPATQPLMPRIALETSRLAVAAAVPSSWLDLVLSLKLHLQRELLVSKPTTLDDVFSLARIIEARFDDQGTSMAETTYDNDARDQVSELEMKVLVDGKQVEAKVVKVAVVVVEQNINEPDVK